MRKERRLHFGFKVKQCEVNLVFISVRHFQYREICLLRQIEQLWGEKQQTGIICSWKGRGH